VKSTTGGEPYSTTRDGILAAQGPRETSAERSFEIGDEGRTGKLRQTQISDRMAGENENYVRKQKSDGVVDNPPSGSHLALPLSQTKKRRIRTLWHAGEKKAAGDIQRGALPPDARECFSPEEKGHSREEGTKNAERDGKNDSHHRKRKVTGDTRQLLDRLNWQKISSVRKGRLFLGSLYHQHRGTTLTFLMTGKAKEKSEERSHVVHCLLKNKGTG